MPSEIQTRKGEPIDKALRRLKKKLDSEGVIKELRARRHYEKPSEVKRREGKSLAKKIAKAIDKAIPCKRVGVTVLGLEVPHAHIHLVPLNGTGLIDFKHKVSQTPSELAATAQRIINEL